jgi:hypothetical protein
MKLKSAFEKVKMKVTNEQLDMTINAIQGLADKHKISYEQALFAMSEGWKKHNGRTC